MATKYIKKPVEDWLKELDYEFVGYMPTDEALLFVNFIKEVNGGAEENETPLVHLKMMDNVFNKEKRCAILCHRGIAKLSTPESRIMTETGWVTMQDIAVGDKIFTRNGTLAEVDYKTSLQDPVIYEIELSDGTKFEVGDEHNHIVWMYRKKEREKVLTTLELLSRPLYAETKSRSSKRDPKRQYTYSIPLIEPLQWPHKELPVDPYTMGYWLANGNKSTIICHLDDSVDILKYFSDEFNIGATSNPVGDTFRFYVLNNPFKAYYGKTARFKHIPKEYAKSSVDQRLELLRGLMDGDGHIAKNGGCSYSSYSKRLAYDVCDLARSLGAISYVKEYSRPNTSGTIEYRVIINIKLNPFRLPRKADQWKPTKKTSRAIVAIREVGKKGGYCIHVNDPTHSYITDGFTVTHNTTLFGEYLILFIAAFGVFPGFGVTNLILYVTDSIENGVKNLRRNVEFRYNESDFLQKLIPNKRITMGTDGSGFVDTATYEQQYASGRKFTDIRLEFCNHNGHMLVVKGYGAKALSLNSILYTDNGITTIKDCCVGDEIYGSDGKLTTIITKSSIFLKPMYRLNLIDGRSIKVSEDHINSIVINTNPNNIVRWEEKNITTKELLDIPLVHTKKGNKKHRGTSSKAVVFIKNCEPVQYSTKSLQVDPYTLGLLIGNGSMRQNGSNIIHGHFEDIIYYKTKIPYEFGSQDVDKRNPNGESLTIKNLSESIRNLGLCVHRNIKFIPECYKRGSIEQRQALLQGLMDTKGTISKRKIRPVCSFCSNSKQLAYDVADLVRSLGGSAFIGRTGIAYRVQVKLNMHVFSLPRKANLEKFTKDNKVAIESIQLIELEPSQCIAVSNKDKQFLTDNYIRTHNTGVRGAKEMGKRPTVALLDDLVSDQDAESATVIKTIENTVYKAVSKALHPTRQKMVWLGTPFNARDPLYKAVESGAWRVSVYPICEHFPCSRAEFRGSWIDRFPYEYVQDEYNEAQALGKPENFNQELMLKIMSDEDRLISDSEINWYSRDKLLLGKNAFNYYITTDYATSEKDSSDFSVTSVWALNYKGYWFWVDGVCKKQLMDQNLNDLFRLAQKWNPQSVGIEVSGQQGGFVPWIQNEMMSRNIYFNIASEGNSNKPGIRPTTNKMVRFNIVLPYFKANRIYFPLELKDGPEMLECMDELTLISKEGFKSKHDDFIDNISQLGSLTTFRPSEEIPLAKTSDGIYELDIDEEDDPRINSYIV